MHIYSNSNQRLFTIGCETYTQWFYEHFPTEPVPFHEKENRILTVGRLDAPEKQTILTVKAFLAAQLPDWELRLVGPMSVSFQEELRLLLDSHPFAAQVTMVGPIVDKVQLEESIVRLKFLLNVFSRMLCPCLCGLKWLLYRDNRCGWSLLILHNNSVLYNPSYT